MIVHRDCVLTVPLVTVLILISLIPGCIQEGVSSAGYFKLSLIPEVMKIVLKSALKGTKLSLSSCCDVIKTCTHIKCFIAHGIVECFKILSRVFASNFFLVSLQFLPLQHCVQQFATFST